MPDENEVVKPVEEPTAPAEEVTKTPVTEEVVTEPEADQQAEVQPEPAPVPDSNQDVDEFGVPWKNRAMEYRRKSEDLAEKLPTMLEEALSKKDDKPQYSREQLEVFEKEYVDSNPNYASWAKTQLRELDRKEQADVVKTELARFKTTQDNQMKRQLANAYTVKQYPDAFLKGVNGQFVVDKNGEPVPNMQNPIGQMMTNYLGDPGLQQRPDRLFIASKLAYADYVSNTQGQTMRKQQQLKEQVGSLQRQTMTEGSGKSSPQSIPAHRKALDRLAQTGSVADAKEALSALLKSKQKE